MFCLQMKLVCHLENTVIQIWFHFVVHDCIEMLRKTHLEIKTFTGTALCHNGKWSISDSYKICREY